MSLVGGNSKNINLSFLQLTFILSMNAGLPAIVAGNNLKQALGGDAVICSIIIGNLILWLIGTAIISMAYEDRVNAIGNAKVYIGKYGGILVAIVLAFSLMNWFVLLISGSVKTLSQYFPTVKLSHQDLAIRFGAALGFFISLLSLGKLNLIKWLSIVGFPVIFLYHVYIIFYADYSAEKWAISFTGVITTILVYLPGIMNLPTIFRHSRSRADSFLGFALMMIVVIIFQIASVLTPIPELFNTESSYISLVIASLVLIIYPLICNNLLNIYLASACWETFLPRSSDEKGGVVFGLVGTAVYAFVQILTPISYINDLINLYLSNFCIVLLVSFIIQTVIRHRPRMFGRVINSIAWLLGCVVTTIWRIQDHHTEIQTLLIGIGAISLFFLGIIFIEEVIWSVKTVLSKRSSKT